MKSEHILADYSNKPNTIPWPPIITLAAVIIGWIAQKFEYLDWIADISAVFWPIGLLMVIVALAIVAWAFFTFKGIHTTIMPNKAASHLATKGPFRFSRNPIYVADIIIISGIGLATGNPWMLITAAAAIFVIEEMAIKREEIHLKAKFGQDWNEYARKVRRWV